MRIRELLEGKKFNDLDFITQDEDGSKLSYDLVEDLAFFMHNDDDTYRRHVYPTIARCMDDKKDSKDISPEFFENAVKKSYQDYLKKYPIRQLPETLEKETFEEVCKKLHDDFCKDYDDGKYKD